MGLIIYNFNINTIVGKKANKKTNKIIQIFNRCHYGRTLPDDVCYLIAYYINNYYYEKIFNYYANFHEKYIIDTYHDYVCSDAEYRFYKKYDCFNNLKKKIRLKIKKK